MFVLMSGELMVVLDVLAVCSRAVENMVSD